MSTKTEKNRSQSSRDNGKKSKGPVSVVGKRVSKMNAVRTGLWCKDIVVEELGESQEEFEEFVGEFVNSLDPHGAAEEMIVHRLAVAEWKMRRAARFEAASVRRHFLEIDRKYRNELSSLAEKIGALTEEYKQVKQQIKVVEKELRKEAIDWAAVYELDWSSFKEEISRRGIQVEVGLDLSDGHLVHARLRDKAQMSDKEVLGRFYLTLDSKGESRRSQLVDNERRMGQLKEDYQAERQSILFPESSEIESMMRYIGPIQRQFNRDFEMLMKLRLFRIREGDAGKEVPQITEGWQAEN